MKTGDRIYVEELKLPLTVRACNERFAVCTRPCFGTVLYFIADFEEQVRGPEDLIFGLGAETDKQCEEMLQRVSSGETAISRRRRVPLRVRAAA